MSIKDYIREINGDRLHFLPHTLQQLVRCSRCVFVTGTLNDALSFEGHADEEDRHLFARARQALDSFSEGKTISIRFPPSTKTTAQLALLDPKANEVWNFRVQDPNPGVRIFGRFAEKDCFIALHYAKRDELRNDDDWDTAIKKCKTIWTHIFPSYQPLKGKNRDDYLTNSFEV